jgi:hypothetical protein
LPPAQTANHAVFRFFADPDFSAVVFAAALAGW